MVNQVTGPAIRAWRIAQGWTQAEAAARLGLSVAALSRIERSGTLSTLSAGRVASLIRQWGDTPPPPPAGAQRRKRGAPRRNTPPTSVERIRAELARDPTLTDAALARAVGVTRQGVAQLRARWGF